MSQVKKMRVFKLTDSQLFLMLQSIQITKRTQYQRLRKEDKNDFLCLRSSRKTDRAKPK